MPIVVKAYDRLDINGRRQPPAGSGVINVRSASTKERIGRVPRGTAAESIARSRRRGGRSMGGWSQTTPVQRAGSLRKPATTLEACTPTTATTISEEVGMPLSMSTIFGPVLAVLPCDNEDEAIAFANDTIYSLAGGVWSGDKERALRVACGCAPDR